MNFLKLPTIACDCGIASLRSVSETNGPAAGPFSDARQIQVLRLHAIPGSAQSFERHLVDLHGLSRTSAGAISIPVVVALNDLLGRVEKFRSWFQVCCFSIRNAPGGLVRMRSGRPWYESLEQRKQQIELYSTAVSSFSGVQGGGCSCSLGVSTGPRRKRRFLNGFNSQWVWRRMGGLCLVSASRKLLSHVLAVVRRGRYEDEEHPGVVDQIATQFARRTRLKYGSRLRVSRARRFCGRSREVVASVLAPSPFLGVVAAAGSLSMSIRLTLLHGHSELA